MAHRVSIIGLGLLGGSLGMALRKAGCEVTGWDRDPQTLALARERGAIDHAAPSIDAAASAADFAVVVATPVLAMRSVFEAIAPHVLPGTVVTDLGSTKRQVTAWAKELLSPETPFVGGHPMAGLEVAGIAHARADLFEGAAFCITGEPEAPAWARERVRTLAIRAGARTLGISPEHHDHLVAAISHLPLLASAALVRVTTDEEHWEAMADLAASGYRDTTRVASGDPLMHRDICATNADQIRPLLLGMAEALREVAGLLDDPAAMSAWLTQAKSARDAWVESSRRNSQLGTP
jgi:prephenate dehydrogenase